MLGIISEGNLQDVQICSLAIYISYLLFMPAG